MLLGRAGLTYSYNATQRLMCQVPAYREANTIRERPPRNVQQIKDTLPSGDQEREVTRVVWLRWGLNWWFAVNESTFHSFISSPAVASNSTVDAAIKAKIFTFYFPAYTKRSRPQLYNSNCDRHTIMSANQSIYWHSSLIHASRPSGCKGGGCL